MVANDRALDWAAIKAVIGQHVNELIEESIIQDEDRRKTAPRLPWE